jgi:catechol 2,3-dioxygenase-like lactoylglutathione lyase family enzyme
MIRHVSAIGEIVEDEDMDAAVGFYRDVLGLSVKHEPGSEYAKVEMGGVLHFAIWRLSAAAEATFGDPALANRIPLGFTLGLEVDEVKATSEKMTERGWDIVQPPKTEPWGQATSRFFSPTGMLCELSETPWARSILRPMEVESAPSE